MVIDARVEISFKEDVDGAEIQKETLFPERHFVTLPLNNLNFMFDNCRVAFNQSTPLTSDL
jgi:hypothetical protein